MMVCYAMSREWYDEIKNLVKTENPFFYQEERFGRVYDLVEVDVDEESFIAVSTKLGWMV